MKNSTSNGSGQYFVEADMLAYEASARIARELADEMGSGNNDKIVLYDQQSFSNLQAYNAYIELVRVIASGYEASKKSALQPAPPPGALSLTGPDILSAVKTGVEILTALRSTTDLNGQKTEPQEIALFTQVSHALSCRSYKVVIPKLVLIDTTVPPEPDMTNCTTPSNTVAGSLSCLLGKRASAEEASNKRSEANQNGEGKPANPILEEMNSLFNRLLDSLSISSGKSPGNDQTKNPSDVGATNPPGGSATVSGGTPSLLSAIITGQQLRRNLEGKSKVLYIGFDAAGGSYRVFHNIFVEVFYRTPTPAFNGGAVASYILFDPSNSTVVKARTMRFTFSYSKFHSKKLTTADNFLNGKTASNEGQGRGNNTSDLQTDVCADMK